MPQPSRYRRRTMWPFRGHPVDESATTEVAQPAAELPSPPVEVAAATPEPPPSPSPPAYWAEVEQCLAAIEAEAMKWLDGRHSLITRHVDALRKLLM